MFSSMFTVLNVPFVCRPPTVNVNIIYISRVPVDGK